MLKCSRCNHQNPDDHRFCGQCGNLLKSELRDTFRAPLEAERRTVTILFADVSGFTAMSEKLDPEEVTAIVNECFTRLTDEIDKYGGIIDKYMGDAIMALFGAPIAHENDPERAIHAALGMQVVLERYSAQLERKAGVKFRMRIGINTGKVIAGYVGSHLKSSYTVLGDAVNLASRIQSAATLGTVLVNQATYQRAQQAFEFEAKEPLMLKGKSEPVQTYEVKAVKVQHLQQRNLHNIASPFVGRARDLATLREAFEQAKTGQTQVVSITGPAGIGKSRLLFEFERALRQEGYLALRGDSYFASNNITSEFTGVDELFFKSLYLRGRSLPYGQLNTYWLIAECLRNYLDIREEDAETEARRKLEAKVKQGRPLIGRFLSLSYPDKRLDRLSSEQLKREMHDALVAILRAESEQRLVMLVLEDLHWIDPSSLDLLLELIAQLQGLPIFFCCTYRSDFKGLSDLPVPHTVLDLSPLTLEDSQTLFEGMLMSIDFPAPLKEQILRNASGNPFYVEEIVKSFIDKGVLVREDGQWKLARETNEVVLPDKIESVIMERIDRLAETPKRILQQSAVIGDTFAHDVLDYVTDVKPLESNLQQLIQQEFIFAQTGAVSEYAFRHLLSHEVAYNSLLVARRRFYHRKIGMYLETTYSGRLDLHLDTLALHFYRGGEWLKASQYAQMAGRHAKTLYANQAALAYFSRIVEIAEWLTSGKADLFEGERQFSYEPSEVQRYWQEALTDRGDVRALIGEYDAAIADYQSALNLSHQARTLADLNWRLGDTYEKRGQFDLALQALQTGLDQLGPNPTQVEAAKIYATLGWVYVRKGNYDLAEEVSHRGLNLLSERAQPIEFALAQKTLGVVDRRRGNYDEAIEHFELSLRLSEQVGNVREAGRLRNNLATVYAQKGNFAEALKQFQLCLVTVQAVGDTYAVAHTYNNLGATANMMGNYAKALEYHELSLATRTKLGDLAGIATSNNNLGETYRLIGQPARAIEYFSKSLEIAERLGWKDALPEYQRQLAQAHLMLGETDKAKAYAKQTLESAQTLGQKLEEAIATRVLAAIAEQEQVFETAEQGYRSALELFGKLGVEQELAATHEALGGLLRKLKRPIAADEQLRSALALYHKLNARKDEQRVLDELAKT